jgi:hypothetical protein
MDPTIIQPLAVLAILVAMTITGYEMHASLQPVSCAECPHCRALVAERERRDEELATWYAHSQGIDSKDDDDRTIG